MDRVYLVVEKCSEADTEIIYACETEELAEYAAKKLNKAYALGVDLEDWLVVDIKDNCSCWKYYEVVSLAIEKTKTDIDEYTMTYEV